MKPDDLDRIGLIGCVSLLGFLLLVAVVRKLTDTYRKNKRRAGTLPPPSSRCNRDPYSERFLR
ncbi:MAG: hypothetical protein RL684_1964 [Pseudomonadota bacterium]|jgi:hypothetical protein